MTFKKELGRAMEIAICKKKNEKKRNKSDWDIISNYISKMLLECASSVGSSREILLDEGCPFLDNPIDEKGKRIVLKDKTQLIITGKDLKRFCKQEDLDLRFCVLRAGQYMVVKKTLQGEHVKTYYVSVKCFD